MPDQSDIQDDDQADPGKSEKQDKPQPIPDRWLESLDRRRPSRRPRGVRPDRTSIRLRARRVCSGAPAALPRNHWRKCVNFAPSVPNCADFPQALKAGRSVVSVEVWMSMPLIFRPPVRKLPSVPSHAARIFV